MTIKTSRSVTLRRRDSELFDDPQPGRASRLNLIESGKVWACIVDVVLT